MALANQLGLTSKIVSERHHYASQTKLTAGEASKLLKKKGLFVSAKEIVKIYRLLKGTDPEWHHSGFYTGGHGKTMGRTFFFKPEDIDHIFNNYEKVEQIILEKEKETQEKLKTIITGYYYTWEHDYNGKYGKKRNFKKLQWYKGSENFKPNNFKSCNENFYNENCHKTILYFGWDEPNCNNIMNPV